MNNKQYINVKLASFFQVQKKKIMFYNFFLILID